MCWHICVSQWVCSCVHVHEEGRRHIWGFPVVAVYFIVTRGLSLNMGLLVRLGHLISEPQGCSWLRLPSDGTFHAWHYGCLFNGVYMAHTVSCLCGMHFTNWTISPDQIKPFKKPDFLRNKLFWESILSTWLLFVSKINKKYAKEKAGCQP